MLTVTVYCIVALISIVNAAETTRIKTVYEGHLVFEDVTKDLDTNTMLIVVDEKDDVPDFRSTVNLHDFNTGYVALKSVAEGVCLLKPLDQEGMKDHLPSNAVENVNGEKVLARVRTMYWNRDPHIMDYEEVVEQAGETLADFCREYKTYNLTPKELDLDVRSLLARQQCDLTKREGELRKGLRRVKRKCGWWARCGNCLNYVDVFGGDVVDEEEKNNL